ncbi:hypothetical protein GGI20_001036 [Coemansia sp. BCRC 34301]|nr:hypothetical protein GGI20_001036 [Coemansia sp. BCRC 34301]
MFDFSIFTTFCVFIRLWFFNVQLVANRHVGYIFSTPDKTVSVWSAIQSSCPSLTGIDGAPASMVPTPYLFVGWMQSIYSVLFTRRRDGRSNITYDREIVSFSDGGITALDWYPARPSSLSHDCTHIVVVLPGGGGASSEYHIRCLSKSLAAARHHVVVLNHRGCGGVALTSPKMYHATHTDDIRVTMSLLSQNYPAATLSCVAFSLGALMLTRYLAEHPTDSKVSAAVAISCPFDTQVAFAAMDRPSVFNDYVFNPNLAKAVKRYIAKHQDVIQSGSVCYDFAAIYKATRLRQIDTLLCAPAGGFGSCEEYYAGASTAALIPKIATPFLAINSRDDSCVPIEAVPLSAFESNPYTALALVNHGGHLGFFTGLVPTIWYIDPVIEFLSAIF